MVVGLNESRRSPQADPGEKENFASDSASATLRALADGNLTTDEAFSRRVDEISHFPRWFWQ
jgi:hypothetical protein